MWAISGHLEKQLVAIAGEAISGHHDKQFVAIAQEALSGPSHLDGAREAVRGADGAAEEPDRAKSYSGRSCCASVDRVALRGGCGEGRGAVVSTFT